MVVEAMKEFFESSSIHGLYHIASERKFARLFWIFVVLGGFIGAGYLIYESFHTWTQSPITTTIETLPISEVVFPNVTVCPPKNLFLNLNYDILQSVDLKLDNEKRDMLNEASVDLIQKHFFNEMLKNLTKIEDPDRYHNWYHGYSKIEYPYHQTYDKELDYIVHTSAVSGNINTKYFGDKFDADKVDGRILNQIIIFPPQSIVSNTTMMLEIQKRTMKEVISDDDKITINYNYILDAATTNWCQNITAPSANLLIEHKRIVSQDQIQNTDLELMPGFSLSWNYDTEMEPWSKYGNDDTTMEFVR